MDYIQAGHILQKAANTFFTIESEKDRSRILQKEAIKNYLCVFLIAEHPESKKVAECFSPAVGLLSLIPKNKRENKDNVSWENARISLNNSMGYATCTKLLNQAKQEIQTSFKEDKKSSVPSP